MNGNGTIDFAPAAEQAAERELDFSCIAVRLGHAGKDLCGTVEPIVDEVIETYVVIARQTHGAGSTAVPAEDPGGAADSDEGQREQYWRQLDHRQNDSTPVLQRRTRQLRLSQTVSDARAADAHPNTRSESVANGPIGAVIDALAQILAGLEVRHIFA